MNFNSQNVNPKRKSKTFNNPERFIEGWYWAIPSHHLRVGEVKAITLLGRELVIYRGKDKKAITFDAYCPHLGAHLAEGKVEGNELRCFFHHWKFDREGFCVDIPCLEEALPIKLNAWPTAEKYGMIWVWTGEIPLQPLPFIPELEQKDCDVAIVSHFVTKCHPNVVIVNGIDSQHFNTVHKLPLDRTFEKEELNQNAIIFSNSTRGSENSWLIKLIRPFYKNAITYSICYWYGSTSIVTVGTDFLHLHIMFTLRLLEGGKAEGRTILMMQKRKGIFGRVCNQFVLWLVSILGQDFFKGDSRIFETIKFDLKTPLKIDQPIIQFVNHLERQTALCWGSWQQARSLRDVEIKDNRDKWRDALND
ncbi:aromatic ring-hydroxylating dioxygenase subunit alpha [Tolypothrix sp. PCC 7910]|uniref:aromatic ring-hydroxylating dioxygenase subunit alpha n=1 Tax=Tolypothrix sp. PCC 7910 TaxID=2099387 RepID=UPI0014278C7D|nr:aromatic ring-hydroxylating dioxygenase subunit alpha [Tolypothrix sp. PCC 7910]QIR41248.1 aromatic ring-hydroxylating dioxygenase subunit alpha [Tolypothrix sp. PCC 7910]